MGILLATSRIYPMPVSGVLLIVFALMPGWPHALHELMEKRWRRGLVSFFGCSSLLSYEGIAAAPEFEYAAVVLGGLPKMCIYLSAELYGHNLLFATGATQAGDWAILIAVVLNGAVLAPAATNLLQAWKDYETDDTEPPEQTEFWSYLLHACDMLALVTTIGTVGVTWGFARFTQWLVAQWLLCGFWPAIAAPPPMPTLRPAVPASGWRWFAHRSISSVLLVATVPPLRYVQALPLSERWVWPFAALMRTAMIVITVPIGWFHHHYLHHEKPVPSWAPTAYMDWVIVFATLFMAVFTTVNAIGLLYRQSEDLVALERKATEDLSKLQYGSA